MENFRFTHSEIGEDFPLDLTVQIGAGGRVRHVEPQLPVGDASYCW